MAFLHECQTASEVREHYKAVRERVRAWKSPEPPPEPVVEPEPEPVVQHIEITVMSQDTRIEVHEQEAEPVFIRRHPSVHRIIGAVCDKYKVSRTDLLSTRRSAYIVRPRHIAMYLAKKLTLRSYPEIGRQLGGRDHSTIIHGARKIATLRTYFTDLDGELSELEALLS
jgi:chromosomal replication initiation ATPase DnaA